MDLLLPQLNKPRFAEHVGSLPSARRRPARHPAKARSELQPPGGLGPTPQSRHVTSFPLDSDLLGSHEDVFCFAADEEAGEETRVEGADAHDALFGSPRWDWRTFGCAKLFSCMATKVLQLHKSLPCCDLPVQTASNSLICSCGSLRIDANDTAGRCTRE